MEKDELIKRLEGVRNSIRHACEKAQIDPRTVNLLAVSKTHPSSMITWAYEAGQIRFGENYAQEANTKQKQLSHLPVEWHFIGKLQKNKVKNVVGFFDLIHSVDSMELAQKISQKAQELGLNQKILLEINLGDESSKGGFNKNHLIEHFTELCGLPNLELAGLMALPPLLAEAESARPFFKDLRNLFNLLKTKLPDSRQSPWKFLSMGTTHDFPVAIAEGANIVRVGTAIFGERPAKSQRIDA